METTLFLLHGWSWKAIKPAKGDLPFALGRAMALVRESLPGFNVKISFCGEHGICKGIELSPPQQAECGTCQCCAKQVGTWTSFLGSGMIKQGKCQAAIVAHIGGTQISPACVVYQGGYWSQRTGGVAGGLF